MTPPPRRGADRSAIDTRLAAIPSAYEELLAAVIAVGEPITVAAVEAALRSPDVARRVALGALERSIEKLVNYLVEIAERGLREAGRAGHAAGRTRGRSLDRLREARVLQPGQRDRLVRLVEVRNLIQHDYLEFAPAELVAAVEDLQRDLHDVVRALTGFLDTLEERSNP